MVRKLWVTVAAAALASALLAGAGSAETGMKRGGTLRINVSNTDFAFVDPALAYDTLSWGLLYTTNLTLLNYPDKPAAASGTSREPSGAGLSG